MLLFFSLQSFAQDKAPDKAPAKAAVANKKTKKVQVSFDDELVKGATEKPDLSNMNTKTDFNYKKLIRVRENFVNEMEGGLDDFKGN
ncbi:hypothetical protein [Bdellovibrio svalbardensis]|uniref:Uncharacterized protein n=1 Tax=Bdellovibrio svalbardensis TaxID=2972972 RepID=A0ABT6DI89_9BACT|nr:hypothetical protein [Bdellovibrio svalbardensis]MDG0815644.1 hypothetical protein [Bdellovibrio svalbardensis]